MHNYYCSLLAETTDADGCGAGSGHLSYGEFDRDSKLSVFWLDSSQKQLRIGSSRGENFVFSAIERKRLQIEKHVSGAQFNVVCFRKLIIISEDLTPKQELLQPHPKGSLASNP